MKFLIILLLSKWATACPDDATKAEDPFSLIEANEECFCVNDGEDAVLLFSFINKSSLVYHMASDKSAVGGKAWKRVIPMRFIAFRMNNIFFDFPEFNKGRSIAANVTTGFFLYRVLMKAHAVKVILVMNYGRINSDFVELVEQVESIMTLKGYENSVCLLILRDKSTEDHDSMQTDSEIVEDIVTTLKSLRKDLIGNKPVQELITSLVREEIGQYVRLILITEEYQVEAAISNIDNNLNFEPVEISTIATSHVQNGDEEDNTWGHAFDKLFTSRLTNAINTILEYYETETNNFSDVHNLKQYFVEENATVTKLLSTVTNDTMTNFTKQFLRFAARFKMEKDENFVKLKKESEYAGYFSSLDYVERKWVYHLRHLSKRVDELTIWHEFLVQLYENFNNLTIAKALSERIEQFWNISTANSMIDWLMWKKFMNPTLLLAVRKMEKTHWMNGGMVRILQMLSRKQVCSKNETVVKSRYVFLSTLRNCSTLRYVVHCSNVFFVDTDYVRYESQQMYVFAREWMIIGEREIKLGGLHGYSHKNRAKYNNTALAGGSGTPGGHFYGMVIKPSNLSRLTIDVSGGNGGNGQDGFDGREGVFGYFCSIPNSTTWTYPGCKKPDFKNCIFTPLEDKTLYGKTYKVYDLKPNLWALSGYDAGCRGKKGLGGSQGTIRLDNLAPKGYTPPKLKMTKGTDGKDGKMSIGGPPMHNHGRVVDTYCENGKTYASVTKLLNVNLSGNYGRNTTCYSNMQTVKPEHVDAISSSTIAYQTDSFRESLLACLDDSVDRTQLLETYTRVTDVGRHTDITNGIKDVLKDFNVLEKHRKHRSSLLIIYEELLSRLVTFRLTKNPDISSQNYITLIYAAISSVVTRIKSATSGVIMLNVDEYFNVIKDNIKNIKKIFKKSSDIDVTYWEELNSYAAAIDNQIDDVGSLMETNFLPTIKKFLKNVSKEIDMAAGDILKRAEEKREVQLRKSIVWNVISGVFRVVGSFLSFMPVYGKIIIRVKSGAEVVTGDNCRISKDVLRKLNVEDAKKRHNLCQQLLDNVVKSRKNAYLSFFNILRMMNKKDPVELLKKDFSILQSHASQIEKETRLGSNLDSFLGQLRKFHSDMKWYLKTRRNYDFFEDSNEAERISVLVQNVGDLAKSVTKNMNKVGVIEKEIAKNNVQVFEVRQMCTFIAGQFREVVDYIGKGFTTATKQVDIYTFSDTKNHLRDLKNLVLKIKVILSTHDELTRLSYQLVDVINSIIGLYDKMKIYKGIQDNIRLNYCLVKGNIPGAIKSNTAAKNDIQNLQTKITVSRIFQQYESVRNTFQQFYFPFAYYHLHEFELPESVETSNVDEVISRTFNEIAKISNQLHEEYSSIQPEIDRNVHLATFKKHPFFVWDNEHYRDEISHFLRGDEIILYADVRAQQRNAVKFNGINLDFTLVKKAQSLPNITSVLETLNNLNVQLIHSGNSYYRCGYRYYVLPVKSQTLQFSIKKNDEGEPVDQNNLYKEILSGYYVLSPYTVWRLQLIDDGNVGLEVLTPLIGYLNINLVGKGQYLVVNSEACKKDLSRFYREEKLDY